MGRGILAMTWERDSLDDMGGLLAMTCDFFYNGFYSSKGGIQ
jgi:hypothetical protein